MGASAMCHAMGAHPDSDEVQQQGCRGLLNLSTGGGKCERAVMDAKGAKMAVAAMLRHPADPGVQWLGDPSVRQSGHASGLGLVARWGRPPGPFSPTPGSWQAPHDSAPLASTCRLPCTRQRRMRPVGRASGGAVGFGGRGGLRDDADAHRAAAPAGGLSGPRVHRGLASFQKGSHVSGWLAWGATAQRPGACARDRRLLLSRRRAMQTTRSRFGPPTRRRWSSRPCATFRCRTTSRKSRSVCLSACRKATPNASRQ